jgi:ubiquinone/menaquinone biosynthesis C-methylase UbiE
MIDPVAFRSDRLPTEHFNARFSDDNVEFWVPLLVAAAKITPGLSVLDVGCGTGGFARAIAASAQAGVTGYDYSERFIEFARKGPEPTRGAVTWVVGDAEQVPFADPSFDRVLLSLVLHQLAHPVAAVEEAFRVLRSGGLVLVRTIAPEDVAERIPERYLPAMAASDAARLPRIDTIAVWLQNAGFVDVAAERHLRDKRLVLEEQEPELRVEARCRYPFLSSNDVEDAIERMRADSTLSPDEWIDPRPTYMIVGSKTP